MPGGIEEITAAARLVKPEAVVWRGDNGVAFERTGSECPGSAHRSTSLRPRLSCEDREQDTLFQRIPWVRDPQAACSSS